MLRHNFFWLIVLTLTTSALAQEDPDALYEQAIQAAVQKVAPSVVQIETSGGTDLVGSGPRGPQIRKGTGPTTGLIVGADGYVISSTFNFANKPSAVFVAVPGHKDRLVAKVVATDQSRMLTLLKVEAKGLPVPAPAPKKEMRVGQTAIALGRTWSAADLFPSVSAGIVSALGRIWGKAIQTDAKVSPVNYGGPLVDLHGRVLGVLVPASPQAEDETAGVDWYDGGIGFAIPLEDILAVLPRLKQGKDLHKGRLGITLQSADIYGAKPVIQNVAPDSAAARAGIQPGDVVQEIDGKPVVRQAQLLHLLGPKYEGDTVAVKLLRGKDEVNLPNVALSGAVSAFIHPFLGVLPMRDDPEPGEEVRYVFPKSPAEKAGLKAGDRIMKAAVGDGPLFPFAGRDQLTSLLNRAQPGREMKFEVQRKAGGKTETIKLRLATVLDTVPDELPQPATHKKALTPPKQPAPGPVPPGKPPRKVPPKEEKKADDAKPEEKKAEEKKADKKKVETGLLRRTNATGDMHYWLYVPENYDANIAHALVVWLHPVGKGKEKDADAMVEAWQDYCQDHHLILMGPQAENETGWIASEADQVLREVRTLLGEYTIDRQRVVAHGMGVGGQFAFYLGFNARDLIRGVAATGAALGNPPKDNVATQRLAFFLVAGDKDPLAPAIADSKARLLEHKFPVYYRTVPNLGHQYLDVPTLELLVRWIDSLDRQ